MEQFAQQFIQTFYTTFDTNKFDIINFYQAPSTLTFEAWTATGQEEIMGRLQTTSFQRTVHQVSSMDCQIVQGSAMVIINVYGRLTIDDDQPIIFTESFILCQAEGNWFILNDIMKLVQV